MSRSRRPQPLTSGRRPRTSRLCETVPDAVTWALDVSRGAGRRAIDPTELRARDRLQRDRGAFSDPGLRNPAHSRHSHVLIFRDRGRQFAAGKPERS